MKQFFTGIALSRAIHGALYLGLVCSPLALSSCKDGGREFRKVLRGAARDVGHSRSAKRPKKKNPDSKETASSRKKRTLSPDEIRQCPEGARIYGAAPPRGIAQWCHAPDKNGKAIRHGEYRRWHKNGKLKVVANYKKGSLDGRREQWYPNGKKKAESNFQSGERHGPWVEYGKDGAKRFEGGYHLGIEHGRFTRWDRHGQIKTQGNYAKGAKSGVWISYNSNGSPRNKTVYANGKREGFVETYSRKGTLEKRESYRNDTQHGPFVSFWSDGNKKLVGLYDNGQKEGQWVTYTKAGNIKSTDVYKNGAKSIGNSSQIVANKSEDKKKVRRRSKRRSKRSNFGKGDILGASRPVRRQPRAFPLVPEQTAVTPGKTESNGGWKSF